MSETQNETQADTPPSYPVSLILRETGATHTIDGGANTDLLRDADGNPEQVYELVADIDGVPLVLASYNYGRASTALASEKARQDAASQG